MYFYILVEHLQISMLLLSYSLIHQFPTLLIKEYLVWIHLVSSQKNEIQFPAEMALCVFLIFCRKISGIAVLEVQFMLCWFGRLVPDSSLAREFPFWLSIIGWRFHCKGKFYLWGYKSSVFCVFSEHNWTLILLLS